jgi:quinoprotein glucose dehydrogenase
MGRQAIWITFAMVLALSGCENRKPAPVPPSADLDWPFYGADAGGSRYTPAAQITPDNVGRLTQAWAFSTGDVASKGEALRHASFEATPLMAGGRVYVCSPFNAVFALNPGTGRKLWGYDPKIDPAIRYPNDDTCRGVAYWKSPTPTPGGPRPCDERVVFNTNDRRLIALDAATGRGCPGFGEDGVVQVAPEVQLHRAREMQITSPPVIGRGVIVVGSSIDDNQRVQEVSGKVRAFDLFTGKLKWSFDPLSSAPPGTVAGAANVWAPMSVDEARGLVFLPTTSPSPDFWGGKRPGDNGDADAVVAVELATGKRVWAFKTVHHDVWDYDNPAQPTLAMVAFRGALRPAVLQPTKQGLLFTLDRDTGAPIIPVQERPVPQGAAPEDAVSPTQPFPVLPRPLSPNHLRPEDAWGITPWEKDACRRKIAAARSEGLYTPPSTQGTILYPFTGGGTNWGGLAFDPARQVVYVNTSSLAHLVTLIPAEKVKAAKAAEPDVEISAQEGAPFGMRREVLRSPLGLPCNPPPWGQLHAIDMKTGEVLWSRPFGTTEALAPGSQFILRNTGAPNFGGPMATATGLVFIGATVDNYLRAFDGKTGKELWRGRLPGGGQATPMSYVWRGRQYVLISAGGHGKSGTRKSDQLVAFALP